MPFWEFPGHGDEAARIERLALMKGKDLKRLCCTYSCMAFSAKLQDENKAKKSKKKPRSSRIGEEGAHRQL